MLETNSGEAEDAREMWPDDLGRLDAEKGLVHWEALEKCVKWASGGWLLAMYCDC